MAARQCIITRAEARGLGLIRYYTGIRCIRGHLSERLVSSKQCMACAALLKRERWHALPVEERRAINQPRYARRWDKRRVENAEYYQQDRAFHLAASRATYWRDPAKAREQARQWRENNREAQRASNWKRKALLRAAKGSHTGAQIIDLFNRQGRRCIGCGVSLRTGYHTDHIVPLSRGGANDIQNIQLLCASCNMNKHTKDNRVWLEERQVRR